MNIWIFILGAMLGCIVGLITMACLISGKISDLEHKNLISYKDGYEKGYSDGSETR